MRLEIRLSYWSLGMTEKRCMCILLWKSGAFCTLFKHRDVYSISMVHLTYVSLISALGVTFLQAKGGSFHENIP